MERLLTVCLSSGRRWKIRIGAMRYRFGALTDRITWKRGLSLARDYGEEMERRFLLYEKIGETGDDEVCVSCLGSVPGSLWC